MKPTVPPPDADRDAWLSEALRHAPDADVAPPPSLSEMILREAQAKAKPAAAATPRPSVPFWSRAWDWMARPAVGAGAASVMLASLVGVMMWNRPLDDMSPRPKLDTPSAPVSALPNAASAAMPADTPSAAAPAQATQASPPPREASRQFAPVAPSADADTALRRDRLGVAAKASKPAQPATAMLEKKREALEQARVAESAQARERRAEPAQTAAALQDDKQRATLKAPPDALAKVARTAESMSPAAPAVEAVEAVEAVAPLTAAPVATASPTPMPPPMPAPVAAPAPAPVETPVPAPTNQAPKANMARSTPAPSAQVAPSLRQPAPASVPLASGFAAGVVSATPSERSFVNLRATLAAEPAPWRWSRDGSAPRSIDDSLSAFLAEVDSVAANRWQAATAGLAETSAKGRVSADSAGFRDKLATGPAVRLLHDGQPVHILRLDGHVLRWERLGADPANASMTLTVTLSEAELLALRRALDQLAP